MAFFLFFTNVFVFILVFFFFFFFNDTATTEIYTLSLHDALPIFLIRDTIMRVYDRVLGRQAYDVRRSEEHTSELQSHSDLVCRLLLEKKKKRRVASREESQIPQTSNTSHPDDLFLRFVDRYLMDYAERHTALAAEYALFFFFNDTATTEIYTLSLHDALPICRRWSRRSAGSTCRRSSTAPSTPM